MEIIREFVHAECFYYMYNKLAPTKFVMVVEPKQAIRNNELSDSANLLLKEFCIFF